MVKKKKEQKEKKRKDIATGKRKLAVARSHVKEGDGKVKINSVPLELWGNEYLRMWVREPLVLAGDLANKVNINIFTRGGGITGQAEAARMSIAKGLVNFYNKNTDLKNTFLQYDRNLLVYDPRRTETHHASGRGASKRGSRRHKQRSKR